jgi:hypothetical protein
MHDLLNPQGDQRSSLIIKIYKNSFVPSGTLAQDHVANAAYQRITKMISQEEK